MLEHDWKFRLGEKTIKKPTQVENTDLTTAKAHPFTAHKENPQSKCGCWDLFLQPTTASKDKGQIFHLFGTDA